MDQVFTGFWQTVWQLKVDCAGFMFCCWQEKNTGAFGFFGHFKLYGHVSIAHVLVIKNQLGFGVQCREPLKFPGAALAYASTRQINGNPEAQLVALVGDWRLKGGSAETADSPLQGRPHTGVYGVEVNVVGDPARARQLLDQVDLGRIKRLLLSAPPP